MSTNWGYVCLTHEPHISSDHWFNHGEDFLEVIFILERNGQWPNKDKGPFRADPANVFFQGEWTDSPIRWLREHPHCAVRLQNEYNEEKDIHELWSPDTLYRDLVHRRNDLDTLINVMHMALHHAHG